MTTPQPDALVLPPSPINIPTLAIQRPRTTLKRCFALAAGASAALLLPHIGCLGLLTVGFVYAGASASLASTLTATSALGLVGLAGAAGVYAIRRSRKACCLVFGEVASVRRAKILAAGFAGFVLVGGVFNTVGGRGYSHPAMTAENIELVKISGLGLSRYLEMCRAAAPQGPSRP